MTHPVRSSINTTCPGSQNSSVYTYQWTPDPLISTIISVVMIVTTLLPAFCSLCYHYYHHHSKQDIILVR